VDGANPCQTTTWDNQETSLLPWEITASCEELLSKERAKLTRFSPVGEVLDYRDRSLAGVDQMESARDFLDSIRDFVQNKAQAQARGRERLGLPAATSKDNKRGWKHADPNFQGMFLSKRSTTVPNESQ
jgi:hypothetical protein